MAKTGKEEPEEFQSDSAICGTLCICQGLAVLSAVSIIYLSVIVYLPAKRELDSGIGDSPVMCTTIERRHTETYDETCSVSSCTEWCLSKGGGACNQIYVRVRQNGTNVQFQGCEETFYKTCPVLNKSSEIEFNCKKDNQCTELEGMFLCHEGVCRNISQVFTCYWNPESEEASPLNCYYKRNCVELEGMHVCRGGQCSMLTTWRCERKCEEIPVEGRNLMVVAGDTILTATCTRATDSRTGREVWRKNSASPVPVLLTTSCTSLHIPTSQSDSFSATDCINGSLIPIHHFGPETNLTTLMDIFQKEGAKHKLDSNQETKQPSRGTYMPFETDITIYNRTLLFINHEGCVNTLQDECKEFYQSHGEDGRNQSFPSRFPCYYAAHNQEFVVRRYDLIQTKWTFLLFFTVPSILLLLSCSMLFICSRVVGVNRQGAMAMIGCCPEARTDGIAMKRLDKEGQDGEENDSQDIVEEDQPFTN